ncbi:putative SMARCAL1-like protein [Aphelenchoides bicaudatus]|nr:putative SMARCAL1-like protein [Aphelenchoides bicaudatus]
MSTMTDEQRAKMEANRQRALKIRKQRELERALRMNNLTDPSKAISPIAKRPKPNTCLIENTAFRPPPISVIQSKPNSTTSVGQSKMVQTTLFNSNFTSTSNNQPPKFIAPSSRPPLISVTNQRAMPSTSNNALSKPPTAFNPLQDYKPKVTISFEAFSSNAAKLTIKPYVDEIKDLVKSYKTSSYNLEKREWTIGLCEYSSLVISLKRIKTVQCTIEELLPSVHAMFVKNNNSNPQSSQNVDDQIFNAKIELCLLKKLFPYQKTGVAFGLQRSGRLLIADEMGLGKSLQALAIARAYSDEWPLLIVCPSSVKYSWKQQIEQFLPNVASITVIEKGTDRLPTERTSNTVIIMSYDLMVNKKKDLLAANIYVVIFDESHLLKDKKTRRTQVAVRAQRRILLSGTPALSRPVELFTQIKLVNPNIFTNWLKFAERYCDLRKGRFGLEAKGAKHLNELALILEHAVMIRRLKKDVLNDLPEKTREILYLSGDKISNQLNELKKSREAYKKAEKSGDDKMTQERLMTLFLETGAAKANCVADWILETYFYNGAEPIKLLLFAHHTSVLDVFSTMFSTANIKTIRIDGSTRGPDRERLCKSFQENPEISIAILSITAAGTGITLTAANKVIFAELYWNPGIFFQAEDRAHRVGQKSAVNVMYILARNTADDVIWPKIQAKIMVVGNLKLNSEKLDKLSNTELVLSDKPKITDFFTVLEQN